MSCKELHQKRLEPQIKAIVLEHMRSKNMISESDVIINEFTMDGYSRRADLVIVRQNDTIAIEVKSESDTLSRLKGQTEKYTEFFDKVIVVTTQNHLSKAIIQTPDNVEVWELKDLSIRIARRGKKRLVKSKSNLLKMMKVRELSVAATKYGYSENKRTRENLEGFLMSVSVKALRSELIKNLQKRYSLTSNYFWKNIANSQVSVKSVANLSLSSLSRKIKSEASPADWLSNISNAISSISSTRY
jgi:hypothetical protein